MQTESELDIQRIQEILPHRFPFLLIDRVLSVTPGSIPGSREGRKSVAIKNVSMNELHFNGHFPDRAIMPGVLIVEAMAQTGGIACYREGDPPMSFVIASILSARFRRPIVPGDQMVMSSEVIRDRGRMIQIKVEAKVDGTLVAETEIMAHVVPR